MFDFLQDIDWEHSSIMQNLPMFLLLGFLLISLLPPIPQEWRFPMLIIGMVFGIGSLFVADAWARVEAAQYIPIKARIMPWKIERTFWCHKPAGPISSESLGNGWYRTPFTLGMKANLKSLGLGFVEKIEIDHELPWSERNMGSDGYVVFKGMEIKHSGVVLVELWTPSFCGRLDFQEVIPRFKLASGSEDYWIRKGRLKRDLQTPSYLPETG